MLNSVIFFWWTLNLVQVASGTVRGTVHLEETRPSQRRTESAFLSNVAKGPLSRMDALPFAIPSVEEQMMGDIASYDEDVAEVVQLQSRAMRSPRRCIPHQQSCLGHQLPCCSPCDTCYCRFFNAICYCRRIGNSCAPNRPS